MAAGPIRVTGAAGRVGGIGRTVTELLLRRGGAVRAMVRTEDQRASGLRDLGAEVVVGNLLDLDSMHEAMAGCETVYLGMSVSEDYLAATVLAAAVAKHHGVKAFVSMSQVTLAQMSITETTASPQHKLHWLGEQALSWSALPVVHVRPTVLLEGFLLVFTADSVRESDQIRLPFGEGRTARPHGPALLHQLRVAGLQARGRAAARRARPRHPGRRPLEGEMGCAVSGADAIEVGISKERH